MALEALFRPGARDDPLPVAPPQLRAELPLLLPQLLEPFLDAVHFGLQRRLIALGQVVPQLDPALAELVDLAVDVFQRSHIRFNAATAPGYSRPPGNKHGPGCQNRVGALQREVGRFTAAQRTADEGDDGRGWTDPGRGPRRRRARARQLAAGVRRFRDR